METAISNDDPEKMLSVLKQIKADVDAKIAKVVSGVSGHTM